MWRRVAAGGVVCALALVGLLLAPDGSAGVGSLVPGGRPLVSTHAVLPAAAGDGERPLNVVLVLADDLDWSVFRGVPRLRALMGEGTTFLNHTVTDSLCCPSRTSIFRSQFVHNHQVVSNVVETGGGWGKFEAQHLEDDCLPVWLAKAGVASSLVGKFLNQYPGPGESESLVPPGWAHWVVPTTSGKAYDGYDYRLNVDGQVFDAKGSGRFLESDLRRLAVDVIGGSASAAREGHPFFLEYASFLPHQPAPVEASHLHDHDGVALPVASNLNRESVDAPSWLARMRSLSPAALEGLRVKFERRLESTESLADSIDALREKLRVEGLLDSTMIVVTSDNGFHLGAHRLPAGKRTAFDEDTVVPLVVIGPGVPRGRTVSALTSTVDLGPTIAEWSGAGGRVPGWVDGRSLVPLLESSTVPVGWRDALVSEARSVSTPGDPDFSLFVPPPFVSLRTERWLLVRYDSGEVELYDRLVDPGQLVNVAGVVPRGFLAGLEARLLQASSCRGVGCWLVSPAD